MVKATKLKVSMHSNNEAAYPLPMTLPGLIGQAIEGVPIYREDVKVVSDGIEIVLNEFFKPASIAKIHGEVTAAFMNYRAAIDRRNSQVKERRLLKHDAERLLACIEELLERFSGTHLLPGFIIAVMDNFAALERDVHSQHHNDPRISKIFRRYYLSNGGPLEIIDDHVRDYLGVEIVELCVRLDRIRQVFAATDFPKVNDEIGRPPKTESRTYVSELEAIFNQHTKSVNPKKKDQCKAFVQKIGAVFKIEEKPLKQKNTRTEPDWKTIEKEFRKGVPVRAIATKDGNITEGGIRKRATREGWTKGQVGEAFSKIAGGLR